MRGLGWDGGGIVIPAQINGKRVTAIGAEAFVVLRQPVDEHYDSHAHSRHIWAARNPKVSVKEIAKFFIATIDITLIKR
jgi:hypothetical protein